MPHTYNGPAYFCWWGVICWESLSNLQNFRFKFLLSKGPIQPQPCQFTKLKLPATRPNFQFLKCPPSCSVSVQNQTDVYNPGNRNAVHRSSKVWYESLSDKLNQDIWCVQKPVSGRSKVFYNCTSFHNRMAVRSNYRSALHRSVKVWYESLIGLIKIWGLQKLGYQSEAEALPLIWMLKQCLQCFGQISNSDSFWRVGFAQKTQN